MEQVEHSAEYAADKAVSSVRNAVPEMRLMVKFNSKPTAQEQMKRVAIREKIKATQTVKERPVDAEVSIKTKEICNREISRQQVHGEGGAENTRNAEPKPKSSSRHETCTDQGSP